MKKIISFILCLMILSVAVITAASAERVAYVVGVQRSGSTVTAVKPSIPPRAGYSKISATLNLYAIFERGSGLSNEGTRYKESDKDSASVSHGRALRALRTSVSSRNTRDVYITSNATGIIDYTN